MKEIHGSIEKQGKKRKGKDRGTKGRLGSRGGWWGLAHGKKSGKVPGLLWGGKGKNIPEMDIRGGEEQEKWGAKSHGPWGGGNMGRKNFPTTRGKRPPKGEKRVGLWGQKRRNNRSRERGEVAQRKKGGSNWVGIDHGSLGRKKKPIAGVGIGLLARISRRPTKG